MFSPSAKSIFWTQFFCWISIPILWAYGDLKWVIASLVAYAVYGGVGVSLTFHRILSHRSFSVDQLMRRFLIVLGSFANVGSPITWVAVHRAHHKFCDTPKDPHSPVHMTVRYMMFGTMFSTVSVKYAVDLLRDTFCQRVHQYYYLIQLPWMGFLYWLGGWQALLALHLVPGGLTWLGGSLVNTLNHSFGYTNHSTEDSSKNNVITGLLVLGEGWHNNHHANPGKATTREMWWEIDLVYLAGCLVGKPNR